MRVKHLKRQFNDYLYVNCHDENRITKQFQLIKEQNNVKTKCG